VPVSRTDLENRVQVNQIDLEMDIAQANQIVPGMDIDPGVENHHIGNLYMVDRGMVMGITLITIITTIIMVDITIIVDGTGQSVLQLLVQSPVWHWVPLSMS
jgi:hypothetical protein